MQVRTAPCSVHNSKGCFFNFRLAAKIKKLNLHIEYSTVWSSKHCLLQHSFWNVSVVSAPKVKLVVIVLLVCYRMRCTVCNVYHEQTQGIIVLWFLLKLAASTARILDSNPSNCYILSTKQRPIISWRASLSTFNAHLTVDFALCHASTSCPAD